MVTYVTRDVPLHGNFELRPLGVAMGNVIPTPPCWGECKPISRKRRALSQLYPKGVAPGTVDGCQWYYPLRPKTPTAYPKYLPTRCRDYRTSGNSEAQKGAACSWVTLQVRGAMLALPTTSSGERKTHSSEWGDIHTLRRERHTHR